MYFGVSQSLLYALNREYFLKNHYPNRFIYYNVTYMCESAKDLS